MPDTTLVLGDFEFARFEIPEQIAFGGEQKLVVHELIGGLRVVDAMGDQPIALEWSGVFVGYQAVDRALLLDAMRKAGRELALTWSAFNYRVIIRSLRCTFQRFYRLPYSITCEVVSDVTTPYPAQDIDSDEQAIGDDIDDASDLADDVGDYELSSLIGQINDAYQQAKQVLAVANQVNAATGGAFNSVLGPVNQAQGRVVQLLAAGNAVIDAGDALQGNGGSIQDALSAITESAGAASQIPALLGMQSKLGRIVRNISVLGRGTQSVTVAGGNLFAVASGQYGDPRGWAAIAAANGIDDPLLNGIVTLAIPDLQGDASGILGG